MDTWVVTTIWLSWIMVLLDQFSSVAQLCPTLCDPMDPMPGFPVHHQFPELAQTNVGQVGDALQPTISFSCLKQMFKSLFSIPWGF